MRKTRAKLLRRLTRELHGANIVPGDAVGHTYTRLKDMWKKDRELYLKHFKTK